MGLKLIGDPQMYLDHARYREQFRWPDGGAPTVPVVHHLIWTGALSAHHELCIKSLLLTQSAPWEVWLWMPPETIAQNRGFIEHLNDLPVVIKAFVVQEEARGSPFERAMDLLTGDHPRHVSNGLRLLALWKYGGFYTDMDFLFMRDIRPLLADEFCYQWSYYPWVNNALFHFRRGSSTLAALIEHCIRSGSTRSRPSMFLKDLQNLPGELCVLPVFAFDPAWIAVDSGKPDNPYINSFDEFFESTASIDWEDFFPHSYAYHWHNRWTKPIAHDTVVGRIYAQVNRKFRDLCERRGWNGAAEEWAER